MRFSKRGWLIRKYPMTHHTAVIVMNTEISVVTSKAIADTWQLMVYRRQCYRHRLKKSLLKQQEKTHRTISSCSPAISLLALFLHRPEHAAPSSFLMPIAIGANPIKPMINEGTTTAMSEPNALIATSKPIPRYCPITMLRAWKLELEKKTIKMKMSSMLVATKAEAPIPIRLTIKSYLSHKNSHAESKVIRLINQINK